MKQWLRKVLTELLRDWIEDLVNVEVEHQVSEIIKSEMEHHTEQFHTPILSDSPTVNSSDAEIGSYIKSFIKKEK